jgi:hypothetical protein
LRYLGTPVRGSSASFRHTGGSSPLPRPALLPAAAPRIALRAALLLGGLFALGFLFGGQAQAADGATPTTVSPPGASVNLVTPPVRERVVRPVG